jgi:anti-sigma regulatory factor (Ser/Thr protein kinase)
MQYSLKSTFEEVHNFENELENQLQNLNLTKRTMFNIRLAFHEAIINVIQHTYKFSNDKDIKIDLNVDEESFDCHIYDYGKKVSPDKIVPKKKKEIQTNGLGVFLYSKLMDEVEFSNTESGNVLRMKKYFKNADFDK